MVLPNNHFLSVLMDLKCGESTFFLHLPAKDFESITKAPEPVHILMGCLFNNNTACKTQEK